MIGIHKGTLANWCNNNVDLLIVAAGAVILFSANRFEEHLNVNSTWQDIGFWALLIGVVTLSSGTSALICYRIILKWHDRYFS
jgi:hypothetical protein